MSSKTSLRPSLVCLTGGIASGKSKVGAWFSGRGYKVICTDEIVHDLYAAGQSLPSEIAVGFGPSVLDPEGGVNRARLAEIVFGSAEMLSKLNAIVHPRVRIEWMAAAKESVANGVPALVIIPLAYETGIEKEFQQVWVTACSAIEQRRRLEERGLSEKQISQRLASQWPLQKKVDFADRVIWNDGDWSLSESQLEFFLREAA